MKKKKLVINIIKGVIMWILSLIVIVPFFMVILNSVKSVKESAVMSLKFPTELHFENYLEVLSDGNIFSSFFNSLLLSSGAAIIILIVSSMAAFVIARVPSKFNKVIYSVFLMGLVAPMNYVTTMKVLKTLNLINTFTGVILLYSAIYIPFTVFIFFGFIKGIPRELDEAAVLDGCGGLRLFFQVIFPLLKPVSVTAFVINFLYCWNDFIIPLYFLNSSDKWGMIMAIYNYFGQFISSWNLVCAAMVINLVPIIIIYALSQKYIVSGMTTGAVKG